MKNNVKLWRELEHISQEELARHCKVSRGTIANLESGNADPKLSLMLNVAEKLDQSIEELFILDHDTEVDRLKVIQRDSLY